MISPKGWVSGLGLSLISTVVSITASLTPAQAISFVNSLTIPGESIDFRETNISDPNINRLGFISDLYYDRQSNLYYGVGDRGPGGGIISYDTRVQKFSLDVDPNTGAIGNFQLLDTILFTNNGANFNGLNPTVLNGNPSILGLSLDPEGFAIAPNGNFYIADEYGPSVYEFSPNGNFLRAFETPTNLLPREADGTINFTDGFSTIFSGRQDNRGYEGVTLSPDGSKLFAIMQDPLVDEGSPDGRRSPNLRLVEFDTVTGQSTAQYIYQLESLADINSRVPEEPFGANSQGRNIGVSAITALNDTEFLVLERDNRGFGVADPTGEAPLVASKRVYKIDISGATDVSAISFAGVNELPGNINPVSKSLFFDIAEILRSNGELISEKMEGLVIGPQLADGSYAIIVGTDNDFSITQIDGEQFNVCTDGAQVALDQPCPSGSTLIPTYLYSFRASSQELQGFVTATQVPEPTASAGLILLGLSAFWLKQKSQVIKD